MGENIGLEKEINEYADYLEQKIEERSKELLLLQKINHALNSEAGLDEILQIIADGVKSTFDYTTSGVLLLSDDKKHLILKNVGIDSKKLEMIEKVSGFKAKGFKVPLFEGSHLTDLIETKKSYVSTDSFKSWEDWTDKPHLKPLTKIVAKIEGAKTRILVPVLAKGKVIGAISASSDRVLTKDDQKRLVAFGEQVGVAVQRAKLYDDWIREDEIKEYLAKAKEIIIEGKGEN